MKSGFIYARKFVAFVLLLALITPPYPLYAQGLPESRPYLTGMVINTNDPFMIDFLVRPAVASGGKPSLSSKKEDYSRLVKYFLASMAIPDKDQWVNLSPYEQERIVPDNFGLTLMGRDLLAQDYILKQAASNLTHPDTGLGRAFWGRVYAAAQAKFGTADVPADVFNKVWVVPDKVVLYEKNGAVYIVEHHLKVMLEVDYLAAQNNANAGASVPRPDDVAVNIMREVIVPVLEKEVNEGEVFAGLRQVYGGMLLAAWYKRALKGGLLNQVYVDRAKVRGIAHGTQDNQKIYAQYVETFRKGAFNLIKEDVDALTGEAVPRHYFSGGLLNADASMMDSGKVSRVDRLPPERVAGEEVVSVRFSDAHEPVIQDDPWLAARAQLEALGYEQPLMWQKIEKIASAGVVFYQNMARKTEVLYKKIGAKAGIDGDTLYYPFAGGDADEVFALSDKIKHVVAMGREPFGGMGQLNDFFHSGNSMDLFGFRDQDGYDHAGRLNRLGFIGGLALARIVAARRGHILNVKYFDIGVDGNIVFLDSVEEAVGPGRNAVIVFRDRDRQVKTFWYCQHEVSVFSDGLVRPNPFRRMINRVSFRSMVIKAAQSYLFEGVMGLNTDIVVGAPARRNDALVLTDIRNVRDSQSGGLIDPPQPVFAEKPASISWLGWTRFGYGRRVFYGRAQRVLADLALKPLGVWRPSGYVPDILVNYEYKISYAPGRLIRGIRFDKIRDGRQELNEVAGDGAGFRAMRDNRLEVFGRNGLRRIMKNVVDVEVVPVERLAKIHYVDGNEWREDVLNLHTGVVYSKSLWDGSPTSDKAQDASGFVKGGIDFEGKDLRMVMRGQDNASLLLPALPAVYRPMEGLVPEILSILPLEASPAAWRYR